VSRAFLSGLLSVLGLFDRGMGSHRTIGVCAERCEALGLAPLARALGELAWGDAQTTVMARVELRRTGAAS
jgi:hypothetical protein